MYHSGSAYNLLAAHELNLPHFQRPLFHSQDKCNPPSAHDLHILCMPAKTISFW
jgi:hypothetical protein